MILDPINDRECLGQLTRLARELATTSAAYNLGAKLRNRRGVFAWIKSLPQSDDDGSEQLQVIQCDVPQRLRLFPADPNCFERALAVLVLLEVVDPEPSRMAFTIDKPQRHTGVTERIGAKWEPIDLFPRVRNAWRNIGVQDVFGVLHPAGKVVASAFGLGGVADELGKFEQQQGWLRPDPATVSPPPRHWQLAAPGAMALRTPPQGQALFTASVSMPSTNYANANPHIQAGGSANGTNATSDEQTPLTFSWPPRASAQASGTRTG
jgi:hypothetical protein